MIGKPVDPERLNQILSEEEGKSKALDSIACEAKSIRHGQALFYKVDPPVEVWQVVMSFRLIVVTLGAEYRVIERPNGIYVYRR